MTATNFRDLLDRQRPVETDSGYALLRAALPEDLLARPVPWVDCPTCQGRAMVNDLRCDNCGASASLPLGMTCSNHLAKPTTCPTCSGTGKATVAQLLAWGQAIADPIDSHGLSGDDDYEAVVWYRNRILDVQP